MSPKAKNGLWLLAVLTLGLGLSAKPWTLVRAERAKASAQAAETEADERRMVEDRAREARLGTELGKEERLRRQGYRKQGETPWSRKAGLPHSGGGG